MNKSVYLPDLPVFKAIQDVVFPKEGLKLSEIAFVCVQHELSALINLFETLITLGAQPNNIYLLGKCYSSCEAVSEKLLRLGINRQVQTRQKIPGDFESVFKADIRQMWKKFSIEKKNRKIKAVIILDDGGRCMAAAPKELTDSLPVIAVEQTTGGITNPDTFHLCFPVIEVASSAAKLWLESPIIAAAAVTTQLEKLLSSNKNKPLCGVIGTGYVGMAVIKKLITLGYEVIGYDKNEKKICEFDGLSWSHTLEDVIGKAKYIFGCTGRDVASDLNFEELIRENKYFFSCSSEDREFLSLLKLVESQVASELTSNILDNICYRTKKNHVIEIFRGGFPITFDGSPQPAPATDIQLTQGLLLCALIQAAIMLDFNQMKNKSMRVMLDPCIQEFVTRVWSKTQPQGRYAEDLLKRFCDKQWIKDHSGGKYYPLVQVQNYFE